MTLFVVLFIVNFIRTIIIIAIIYFGIRIISRYILPLLIDKGVKNMQQKMQNQQRQQQSPRPEGEVTLEKKPTNKRQNSQNDTEYVDFEEVE